VLARTSIDFGSWEEEPNYTRQKKEISVDPQLLQKVIQDKYEPPDQKSQELKSRRTKVVWKVAQKVLKDKPVQYFILYLKYHVGMAEPKIAKLLKISQPWARCQILSCVNAIRKKLRMVPLKKIIEHPSMVRNKDKFKKPKKIKNDQRVPK